MRAFDFRLQTKLEVSNIEAGMAKEQLHHSISTLEEVANRSELLNSQLMAVEQTIRSWNDCGGTFQVMVSSREYLPVLDKKKARVDRELDLAEQKVEKDRDLVFQRFQETNTLEKLKDKDWSSYRKAIQTEEQKLIDELANSQFYRNHFQAAGV